MSARCPAPRLRDHPTQAVPPLLLVVLDDELVVEPVPELEDELLLLDNPVGTTWSLPEKICWTPLCIWSFDADSAVLTAAS